MFGAIYRVVRRVFTKRDPGWGALRREIIAEFKQCAACGSKKELEAHHVVPFHLAPEREMDKRNLIVLCRDDHYTFGHFKNWKRWNPDVRRDVVVYRNALERSKVAK